jgi:eukaryotic-like serine/threonine-protein kinase
MADVFEAWDVRLERHVAIKRYRAAPYGDGLRRFMAEAELLGGLSHPGLLTVFDVSFDGERPFLVLKLARGGTLRDRLDTGSLPPARVAEIGAAVAEVLTYVHAKEIVHRDLKPSNLLFDSTGECYLADFGIAKALGDAHISVPDEFIGTAAYLAPEQVGDSTIGPAADVYSLGLVLLECLTGHTEYDGTDLEMALARLSRPPRIPGTWGPEWQAVLTAMTATDPAERPDAAQCVPLLRALEAGTTIPMTLPVRQRSRRRMYAGGAMVAAAAAAAIVLVASPVRFFGDPTAEPTQVEHTTDAPVPSTSGNSPAGEAPAAEQAVQQGSPAEQVAQQESPAERQAPPAAQAGLPPQGGPAGDDAAPGKPVGGPAQGPGQGQGPGKGPGHGKGGPGKG